MVQTLVVADPLADLTLLEGVPSAVVAARAAVDAVLRDRGFRQITAEQSAQALLAGARASAQLSDDPERWLSGAVRLYTELVALSPLVRVSPGQAMARAHALLAHGMVPAAELGRVRDDDQVSQRIVGLTRLLTSPTTASAIVLAAVVHAELATVEPFGCGDALLARCLEHMVLIDAGVDPAAVIVVEAGHLAAGEEYERRLVGYRDGGVAGVKGWLLHCAQAVAYGAEVSGLSGLSPSRPRRS